MKLEPAARYGSALEMLSELQHICSDPLLALPEPSDRPENGNEDFEEVIDTEIIDVGGETRSSKRKDASPEPPIVVSDVSVNSNPSTSSTAEALEKTLLATRLVC